MVPKGNKKRKKNRITGRIDANREGCSVPSLSKVECLEIRGILLGPLLELAEPPVEDVRGHHQLAAVGAAERLHEVEQVLADAERDALGALPVGGGGSAAASSTATPSLAGPRGLGSSPASGSGGSRRGGRAERAEEREGAVGGGLEVDGDGLPGGSARRRPGAGRRRRSAGRRRGERGEVERPGVGRHLREGGGVEREAVVREDDAEHGGGGGGELAGAMAAAAWIAGRGLIRGENGGF